MGGKRLPTDCTHQDIENRHSSELCSDLVIPASVANEIYAGLSSDPVKLWISQQGRGYIHTVPIIDPAIMAWDLGTGETEVLTWALQNKDYEAVVDDRAARNCAASLSIPVRGTLGLILLAKKEHKINSVRPVLQELMDAGFHIGGAAHAAALQLADE